MTFAANLKRLRLAAQLTQEQLAHAIGAAGQSRIANYERGTREPTLHEIQALAEALAVNPIALTGWKQDGAGKAQPQTPSQFARPDPGTLHAALELLAFDEEQAGRYTARARTARLVDLYDRVAADGGVELSASSNRHFEQEVRDRERARDQGEHDARSSPADRGKQRRK